VVSFPLGDARFRESFPAFTPLAEPDGVLAEMEAAAAPASPSSSAPASRLDAGVSD
jgi:hypothetical protein